MYGRCKDKLVLMAKSSKKIYVHIQRQIESGQVLQIPSVQNGLCLHGREGRLEA